ncbi:MAG: hypothetical protein Q8P02_02160, partial [Candidatus Micrarchaeota archaeon]|nr:hypothetical protein [Candidatus Micrarchaeota archaeon]
MLDFFKPVDPETGIRATILMPCSDSRMTTRLFINGRPEHPDNFLHVANAGAYPNQDLRKLVEHLEKSGIKRKEILVINAAHFEPTCGGSRVNAETVKKMKAELNEQLGIGQERLDEYLHQYGHAPQTV